MAARARVPVTKRCWQKRKEAVKNVPLLMNNVIATLELLEQMLNQQNAVSNRQQFHKTTYDLVTNQTVCYYDKFLHKIWPEGDSC